MGSSAAFATKYIVLESQEICSFYQDPKGCYQQAMQMIASASGVGKIEKDGRECVFADGGKAVFNTNLNWMLLNEPSGDWNFEILNPDGSRKLHFRKDDTSPYSGFAISGKDNSGVQLRISFSGRSSYDRIEGTVNCDMNFGTGEVVYILNTERLYEAQKICPAVIGIIDAVPHLSYLYSQVGNRTQVRPYVSRAGIETDLFTCRNY